MYDNLAIIAIFALAFSAIAGRVERSWVTGPMVYIFFGLIVGPVGLGWYCQLKAKWADFLPRASNLNAAQSMSYQFVYCLIFVQIHLT